MRSIMIASVAILGILVSPPGLYLAGAQARSSVEVPDPEEHPAQLLQLTKEFPAIRGWGQGVPDYAAVVQRQKEQLPKISICLD